MTCLSFQVDLTTVHRYNIHVLALLSKLVCDNRVPENLIRKLLMGRGGGVKILFWENQVSSYVSEPQLILQIFYFENSYKESVFTFDTNAIRFQFLILQIL